MSNSTATCQIVGCNAPSSGTGAQIDKLMCEKHLNQDRHRVRQLQKSVLTKLEPLFNRRDALQKQQQALFVELQNSEDLFDLAIESLIKWKETVTSRLSVRHESLLTKLRQLAELREFKDKAAEAERANDFKKVFELTAEMDLHCEDLIEKLQLNESQPLTDKLVTDDTRSVGDVSGGLRDLQLKIDTHMREVVLLCNSAENVSDEKQALCEYQWDVKDLEGKPKLITSCSNTKGFVGESSGTLVKVERSVGEGQKLPEPCLFIVFNSSSNVGHSVAMSIDGSVRLRVRCNLDWSEPFSGLCCDSSRQLLYFGQRESVTVTDLGGRVMSIFDANNLKLRCNFKALGCGTDKLFVLNKAEDGGSIICLDKDTGKMLFSTALSAICSPSRYFESIFVSDSSIFVTDWQSGLVHKLCGVTMQRVTSYPNKRSNFDKFQGPAGVAVHSSGLLFVSDELNNSVRVMQNDGIVVQNLEAGPVGSVMNHPYGLCILDGDPSMIAVCQVESKSITFFKINF